MDRKAELPVKYDPDKHDGILHFAGQEIIVANASQAKLDGLPLEAREAIAKDTQTQLNLIDFSRGSGGIIIEITDEAEAAKMEEGYKKGLKLLKLE